MGLTQDIKYALRQLLIRPGFTMVAAITLAIGIGANAAVFSVVEAVLLRPLPFRDPDRLVFVWEHNVPRGVDRNVANPANFVAWRERSRSFEAIGAFAAHDVNLSDGGEPERVAGAVVTGDLFPLLGAVPVAGRSLAAADARPDSPDVAVISAGLWSRRYAADPSAVGRAVMLNGRPTTIVGVMPEGFTLPPGTEIWIPYAITESWRTAGGRWLFPVARLAPGVDVAAAGAEMQAIASTLEREFPDRDAGWTVTVAPLRPDLVRDVRAGVLVLMGGVVLLLLVACANVANLLLARSLGREREIALRLSLGAGRMRIVRQLLVEGIVLAAAGGALAILLALWTIAILGSSAPLEIRQVAAVTLNRTVLLFMLGVTVASALLFSLVPAWQAARPSLLPALREGTAGSGVGRRRRRLASLLVVSEVAAAIVLLVGSALLLRSYDRLSRVGPGFDPRDVVTFEVALPSSLYREPERQARFFADAAGALARIPGVEAAGAISWVPFSAGSRTSFTLPDRPAPAVGQEPVANVRMITPDLFRAMGIPLLRGRAFQDLDAEGRPDVVIVSEGMARRYWPGEDPVGKRVHMPWFRDLDAEVVGVVADVRLRSLDEAPGETLYWPNAQSPYSAMTFMIRTPLPVRTLLPQAKAAIAKLDPALPLGRVQGLEQVVGNQLDRSRFTLVLTATFGILAGLLAAVGIYGVIAHSVHERRAEVGVRVTLGATPSDLIRLVLGNALLLAGSGTLLGFAAAAAGTRMMRGVLYETSPADPLAYAGAAALVLAVAILAGGIPARRAARIDPIQALRCE